MAQTRKHIMYVRKGQEEFTSKIVDSVFFRKPYAATAVVSFPIHRFQFTEQTNKRILSNVLLGKEIYITMLLGICRDQHKEPRMCVCVCVFVGGGERCCSSAI